jgi:hypothetical protein
MCPGVRILLKKGVEFLSAPIDYKATRVPTTEIIFPTYALVKNVS